MLPRNDKTQCGKKPGDYKTFFIITLFLLLSCSISSARAENIFIKFYQDHISVINGNRCPMYPSCSAYASQAIEKHGPILGWVMACDRIIRCGRDEIHQSETIIIADQKLVFDPVEANDFWWINKE